RDIASTNAQREVARVIREKCARRVVVRGRVRVEEVRRARLAVSVPGPILAPSSRTCWRLWIRAIGRRTFS
ncbi:hypothetical protein PMAYCL1PPCAC_21922, partial [Pristionchus mayeri]